MTTSIRSMPLIAILVAAAIVPVASAGASVVEPVLAGNYSAAPDDKSSGTSSLTALGHPDAATPVDTSSDASSGTSSLTSISHDYGAPVDQSSGTSSLTSISHDYGAAPVDQSSSFSSVTALSPDSNPTVTLHRDGSKAEAFVANVGPEPTTAPGDGFDWGDAGIGAGAVALVAGLAMLAGFSVRRSRSSQPATAASQSA
jgi:hypothetical protein